MTKDKSYLWFVIPLLGFIAMMLIIGASMAKGAGSGVDQVPKLIESANPSTNFAFIRNDTLFMNNMAVSVATLLKAVALQADTLRGSGSIVGIIDDTLRFDVDSTGSLVTMTFGGYGGGIRWNRGTDAMEFTNDFTTWTTFGSGSGTGDIEGVTAGSGLSGGGTTGTPTLDVKPGWGLYIHDDSVKVRFTALLDSLSAADRDSIFVAHFSSRWRSLADSSAQYIGDPGDSSFLVLSGAKTTTNTDDAIIAFTKIYYGEKVVDSALVTYGTVAAMVGVVGSGDITGVITSPPLTGGASSGDVSLGLDWTWLWSFNDTMSAKVDSSMYADSTKGGAARAETVDTSNQHLAVKADIGTALQPYDDSSAVNVAIKDSIAAHWAAWVADVNQSITLSGDVGGTGTTAITTTIGTDKIDSTHIKANGIGYTDLGVGAVNKIKATVVDSATGALRASLLIAGQGSANTAGRLTLDSLIADTLFATRGNFTNFKLGTDVFLTDITGDGLAVSGSALTASLGTAITSSEITDDEILWADLDSADAKNAVRDVAHDTLWQNSPNYFKTAGNGLTSSTSTVNVVVGANGLTVNADSLYIDTTKILRTKNLIANWVTPWPDSTLSLGSGAGLIINSSVTLGTDITDDTLVVDYYPEYTNAVLADLIIPVWKDSIKIYGYIDTVAGMGNTMYFNDSVLTSGLHRRGFQLTINHPMRVDSLRYIIVQGLVKDSSGTNSMYLKGMLRTSTFRTANVDSNTASTVKDYDSLGGDYTDAATVRQFVLTGGAVTPGTPWYLLLTARHVSGTAWNWAQAGRIRAVYSRTRL